MMLFSIIIPTYKGNDCIGIAIQSVINQTLNDYEIIVSDDNVIGSEEQFSTEKIVNKYIEKYKNIKYIKNGHHNGSYARNMGIKASSGDYIALLDDDDFYLEHYLKDAYQYFKKNNVDILFFDILAIDNNNHAKYVTNDNITSKKLVFGDVEIGTGSNICFKRSIFDSIQFDEKYYRHQDIEFVARILSKYTSLWIKKLNIIKYYNNNDNYPNLELAISMQKLLRDEMQKNNIISNDEYSLLKRKQIQSFFSDQLLKHVPESQIKLTTTIMKEYDAYTIKNRILYIGYRFSKKLFSWFSSKYIKIKFKSANKELVKTSIAKRILLQDQVKEL